MDEVKAILVWIEGLSDCEGNPNELTSLDVLHYLSDRRIACNGG